MNKKETPPVIEQTVRDPNGGKLKRSDEDFEKTETIKSDKPDSKEK